MKKRLKEGDVVGLQCGGKGKVVDRNTIVFHELPDNYLGDKYDVGDVVPDEIDLQPIGK